MTCLRKNTKTTMLDLMLGSFSSRQTGHRLGQEVATVSRQRSGTLLQSQTKEEVALGIGQGDAIDPAVGQESGPFQPLIRMTIDQETTAQLLPKIERQSTRQSVARLSGPAGLAIPRHPREAGTGGEPEMCFIVQVLST